jgi:hypothetical protein
MASRSLVPPDGRGTLTRHHLPVDPQENLTFNFLIVFSQHSFPAVVTWDFSEMRVPAKSKNRVGNPLGSKRLRS